MYRSGPPCPDRSSAISRQDFRNAAFRFQWRTPAFPHPNTPPGTIGAGQIDSEKRHPGLREEVRRERHLLLSRVEAPFLLIAHCDFVRPVADREAFLVARVLSLAVRKSEPVVRSHQVVPVRDGFVD